MHKLTITGVICGAVSLVLCTTAISSKRWLAENLNLVEVYYGLWTNCSRDYQTGHEECELKELFPDWTIATIFLEMAGLVLIVGAVIVETVHICIPRYNDDATKIPGLCAITGGLVISVGAIIWAAKYTDDQNLTSCYLSGGLSLAIVSAAMSIPAGSLFLLAWRAKTREHSYMAI